MRSCTARLIHILRKKQRRNVSGRDWIKLANCLSRCAGPSLSRKGHVTETLTQSKYSQASKGKTERQNWIQNKFYFLKTHIRFKRIIRLQVPSLMNASAASLHDISIALTDMDSMEISMRSNTIIQPPVTSPSAVSGQPADHGPVCTDENHTAIIHWANVGDNTNSLL